MRHGFVLLLLGLFTVPTSAAERNSAFAIANPREAIGEMGAMGLWRPGAHISIENDWIGGTDKLVTATAGLDLNTLNSEGYSFNLGYHWRLVTPIEETRFGQPQLSIPIGPLIDWQEASFAASKTEMRSWGGIKVQLSASYNLMYDNYGKHVLHWAHNLFGASSNNFGPSYRSWHWGGGAEISYLAPPFNAGQVSDIETSVGLGWNQNDFMHEAYVRAQLVAGSRNGLKLAFEGVLSGQVGSPIFGELIKRGRYEAAAAVLYTRYTRAGIRYVSPYLEGDEFGQWYLEFIGIHVPF